MKIGIDARTILNPEKGEAIGVGHYTYQLIRHLLKVDTKNEYVLFFDFRVREKDIEKFKQRNVKIKFYPFSDYKKYLPGAYNEILGSATLAKEDLDIIHTTSPLSRIPVSYQGKVILTVSDLGAYQVPDVFPKIKRAKIKTLTSLMTDKAKKIVAVSDSTKEGLKRYLKCPEEKIEVIRSGFDNRFLDGSRISREKVLEKYAVKDKYILFLGTLDPVKNIVRLLEAFKLFREKIKGEGIGDDYKLILAGKRGWLSEEYRQIAKDLELDKSVKFIGYVVGDDLVPLFREAEFFVMPSLYEGFGTTVLEALASGTPAIISNVSSLPEVAGDAAIYINPMDTEGLANEMFRLSKDDSLKYSLREKGREQAKKFNWEKCARETLEIYKKVFEEK
ncbi:MAG: glycosyltransferase family 4 protein [Patescibacteria group bacterium]